MTTTVDRSAVYSGNQKASPELGVTLVEMLVSLAIVGILSAGIFTFIHSVYTNEINSYNLAQRTQKALIMKAALDNIVSNAGSISAPTLSSVGTEVQNGTPPFDIGDAIGQFLYGNCPSQGIFAAPYNFLNQAGNNILSDLFNGGYNSQHTTATNGDSNLTVVAIPSNPLAVTASTISFAWLTAHTSGGNELCQGSMQIVGNQLIYQVSGSAVSGHSTCGLPLGANGGGASFPIGSGWSFYGPIPNSQCLGDAYPNSTPEAIVAIDASAYGLASTEVTVCLPAM